MIEVFDAKRTRSYGCFASFKAATDTLDSLAATGQLGSVPAVSVAAYCSGVLQREYEAVFVGGKWRVPKSPKRRMPETRPARGRRRRKWCKEYATAELMFREGFPDHLNRSYPLSAVFAFLFFNSVFYYLFFYSFFSVLVCRLFGFRVHDYYKTVFQNCKTF